MPLYMDIHHKIDGLTAEAIKGAHEADVKAQDGYGVKYIKYWFDEGSGKAFCLVEAPNAEAANAVHKEAHGLVADEIIEVQEGS
ncbi:MAG: nickel-binding protein [Candidatus Dormiibacterota bacterium]